MTTRGSTGPSIDQPTNLTRRTILKAGASGLLGTAVASMLGAGRRRADAPPPTPTTPTTPSPGERRRLLRIAHLTDTHIQPERSAFDGVRTCLEHCQSHKDKPDILVTGGDMIMDAYDQGFDRTKAQWELWTRVLKDHCSLPVASALGNHDIWGWNKSRSKTRGNEANWGKKWACQIVGRDKPWHTLDVNGVRLVLLDSVQHDPRNADGYIGQLDDEQSDWLKNLLRDTPKDMPIVVTSHIPILTVTGFTVAEGKVVTDDHTVSMSLMHADSPALVDLFEKHGNVRACLSGHTHLLDRVDYRGVSYLCNGAVCGSWWKGPRGNMPEGYALVDLYSDGSVERTYLGYGWKASEKP